MTGKFLFLAWFALPVLAIVFNIALHRKIRFVFLFVLSTIIGYLLLLVAAEMVTIELQQKVDAFEQSGNSDLPEAQQAMRDLTNDTGRALAPITGIPLTAIWYGFVFAFMLTADWILKKLNMRKKPKTSSGSNELAITAEKAVPSGEDDNPFRPPNES